MRKALAGVVAVVLVVGASAISYWAGSRANRTSGPTAAGAAPPKAAPPGVVVEATRVSVMKLPQALGAVGSLRSDETVILRPEIAGRVAQINFKEGERVTKGQV